MKYTTATVRGLPRGTTKLQVENNFNLSIHHDSPCVAGPIVDELQGNTCSTTVTFRSEKHGRHRTCEQLRDFFNRSDFRGSIGATISVTDDFLGLTPLAGEANAPVHIYFVHGLGGHAFNTWSSDVSRDHIEDLKAWPRDFLPQRLAEENIKARIYTLGYRANMVKHAAPDATINSAAEDLLAALDGNRHEVHPQEIYFVCHSLGGLIVCQALSMALFQDHGSPKESPYRYLFAKDTECMVKGVVLMGTPLRGSGQATLFAPYIKAIRQINPFYPVNDSFIKSLSGNQPIEVSRIIHRFQRVMEEKKFRLMICCEEMPVAGAALTTDERSAKAIFDGSAHIVRIHKDHRQMVKFDDKSNGEYKNLENHIVKMMRPPENRQSLTAGGNSANQDQIFGQPILKASKDARHERSCPKMEHQPGPQHRQQTFPQDPSQLRRPLSGTSAKLSRGLTGSTLVSRQHGSVTSRTSRVLTGHNAADDGDKFNRLLMFDTVFIVDDTGSMTLPAHDNAPIGGDRWAATTEALQHITGLAANKDTNGIDIRFLKSHWLDDDEIDSGDKVMAILEQVDMSDEFRGGGTFFKAHLEDEISPRLEEYRQYVEKDAAYKSKDRKARARLEKPQRPKMLNLIVITDGQADDKQEVEDYIVETAEELDRLKAPAAQIGIQFVQIGEDESARKYLKHLDDELKQRDPPIRDIVDTTPCDSDLAQDAQFQEVLVQVLLGAITKDIDERNTATT